MEFLVSVAKDITDYDYYEELKKKKIPVVFFDRANDDTGISSVVIDDYKGAYIATEHLIKNGITSLLRMFRARNI